MRKQGNKTKNVFKFKSTKKSLLKDLLYLLKIILQDLQIFMNTIFTI